MPSPYEPGHRNAVALGLAMGAEAAGVTAGVVTALALGAAISATDMAFDAGTATKVTSETTLVITHGLGAAPTFLMVSPILKPDATGAIAPVANTTSITVTRTTATSSWSYSYIAGV